MDDIIELEALDRSGEVLEGYDPSTDTWAFAKEGAFWRAVNHAHSLGYRGKGSRAAIIDSGCDLTIPRLSRQVRTVRSFVPGDTAADPIDHGTTVALLLTEVAPECTLDIYRVVSDDGKIDQSALIEALHVAAKSDAAVVNLSLGIPRLLPLSDTATHGNPFAGTQQLHKSSHAGEDQHCPLCQAASRLAATGKLVFAAVGNSILHRYCPARAANICAVGFQLGVVEVPHAGKEIRSLLPQVEQSLDTDLMLLQVPGRLGSSFSCPLYAGVGALGLSADDLFAFVRAYKAEVNPLRAHGIIDTSMTIDKTPTPLLSEIEIGYWEAIGALPHVHCELQARLRQNLPITDPSTCPFCGIFAGTLCTMFGWWLMQTGRSRDALSISFMAHQIAPWDSHALAHIGSFAYTVGDIPRAIDYLEAALRNDPDNRDARIALSQLQRGEATGATELLDLLSPPERMALALAPHSEQTRLRQRSVARINEGYYFVTAVLFGLHMNFPSASAWKWLLVPCMVVGALGANMSFKNLRVSRKALSFKSWQHEPGSSRVIYEMRRLNRMLVASAAGFVITVIALVVVIVLF